ncbi:CAAX amino terminal protease [Gallaecimonas xiamenensis 3-C-1]|uniref:CAAX amino terminal protease n=2 Tax=Gallaecimonas TaxID=745410 RepID=K2J2X8_9GAMM|nr:CAAX amino terminal protease [Gallaecimonas xiamenensis 3-C-1]
MAILFLGYSLLILAAGLSPVRWLRYGLPVTLLLLLPLGGAGWSFCLLALSYVALTAWMKEQPGPAWLAWLRGLLWFGLSLGLMVHQLPGYQGLLLAQQAVVKTGSVAVNLYLNTDKVLVAWSLLCWCPLVAPSLAKPWRFSSWWALAVAPMGIALLTLLAMASGLVDWQPGLSPWFWLLAATNLLNTCMAEELLFRGLLLRWLQPRWGSALALLVSSILFGMAHLAGGWGYVGLATLAGGLYGLMLQLTGRLAPAVLCHWALNLTQLLLLTWPLSQR